MIFTSLDSIVRRTLLEKGLSIHWYAEFLFHAASCLRQATIETLKIINTVTATVNEYYAFDLPTDFTDDLGVFIPVGQLLHPIPKNDSITALRTLDTDGDFAPYTTTNVTAGEGWFGGSTNWLFFYNINDYGEPTGRYFGATGEGKMNSYKLVKERRQIQLSQTFTSTTATLLYISDGQSTDSATQIDMMAYDMIQAYINWKGSPNADNENSPEGRMYYNQRRLCRARLDDLTIHDLRNLILRSYSASIKN